MEPLGRSTSRALFPDSGIREEQSAMQHALASLPLLQRAFFFDGMPPPCDNAALHACFGPQETLFSN